MPPWLLNHNQDLDQVLLSCIWVECVLAVSSGNVRGKTFFFRELLMLVKRHSFSNNLIVCTRKRWHGKCLFAIRVRVVCSFVSEVRTFFSEHERLGLVLNAYFWVMLRLLQNARVLVTLWWLDCIVCNYCGEIPRRIADLCPFLSSSSSIADVR